MDNIEVRRILENDIEFDGRKILPDNAEELYNQFCKLFPQPLDDKELREKLRHKLVELFSGTTTWVSDKDVELILALLQPKIEEAKRELMAYIEKNFGGYESNGKPCIIIHMGVWQALKREESNG